MRKYVSAKYSLFFSALIVISCSKPAEDSEAKPIIPAEPQIEIKLMYPMVINQFETVTFHIGYTDGDGDLGDQNADVHSLEILDTRDSILYAFHVPPQSPIPNITISGVLDVDLENVILLDQSNSSEATIFKIRLRDKFGHWSQVVDSPVLTINK